MMGLFVIGMLVMFLAAGAFAVQNPDTAQFHFLSYVWALPQWAPALIGVGVMAILLVLHMSFATIGTQLQRFGYHREIGGHRDTISGLEEENARLREQLAEARGVASVPPATRPAAAEPGSGWRGWLRSPREMASRRSSTS